MKFKTMGQMDTPQKTVLLRVDFNSPIDPSSNLILDDKRFREHVPTIQALEEARCVILTHQSRPGKKDFTPLQAHASRLERLIGRPVTYVDDIFGRCAKTAVREMKPGEVVMLENLRFNAEENLNVSAEEAAQTHIVRRLADMGDLFINDAFGTAHRSQPTLVGLPLVMPSAAGLLMEREITSLSRVFTGAPEPVTFVLGGTKVDDSLDVAVNVLGTGIADQVIVTGMVANIFILAAGFDIGRPSTELVTSLGYQSEVPKAQELLKTYRDKIIMPESVAVEGKNGREEHPVDAIPVDAPVFDLGRESIDIVTEAIRQSGTVVLNGPAGVFENEEYATGTLEIIKACADAPFSVVGGGHTSAVIESLGLDSAFSHISTGGGACIEFLTGKKLPAIAALERSKELFG